MVEYKAAFPESFCGIDPVFVTRFVTGYSEIAGKWGFACGLMTYIGDGWGRN
jgi:hypothetical protein